MDLSTKAYLDSVVARGSAIMSSTPANAMGAMRGLGDTVSVSQFLGGSDDLSQLASSFSISLTPVPTNLSAIDHQAALVSELVMWQTKAEAVVVMAEQNAGIPVGGDSATDRIIATRELEDQITSVTGKVSAYAGSVLPEAIAPKVSKADFARSLRRQYNSAAVGILAHTPQGIVLLSNAGASEDDIQRDYLYRMTTFQSIAKIGEQTTATNGLGFLFLVAPLMALVAVFLIVAIAAALVCTRYLSQRNEIWSNVMAQCAQQSTSSAFCTSAVEQFAQEPKNTIFGALSEFQNYILIGIGVLVLLRVTRKK